MPAMVKCPNCNAPLEHAPTGPEAKCPYCGVALVATRLMNAPPVVGPPMPQTPFVPPLPQAPGSDLERQRRVRRWIVVIVLFAVLPGLLAPIIIVLALASGTSSTTTTTVTTGGSVVVTTIRGDGGVLLQLGPGSVFGVKPAAPAEKPEARPALELRAGMPLPVTLERGAQAVQAKFRADAPGLYSVEMTATDDLELALADAEGNELMRRSAETDEHRATLIQQLVAGDYVVQALSATPATANVPVRITLTRVEPAPLELGRTVDGRISPAAGRAWYEIALAAPTPLRAKVVAPGFAARLFVTHSGGSAAVSSPPVEAGVPARLETDDALPAGTYRVEVSGDPPTGADGAFRLLVAARTPDPEPLEPAERTEFQRLRGCGCRMDIDGLPGNEAIDLAAQMLGHSLSLAGGGASTEYRVGYAVAAGDGTWLGLPVEEPSAPSGDVQGNSLGVGVGCASGLLVVASGSWVTGWSLRDRKRLWNTELDGRYPSEGTDEGSLVIDCRSLRVSGGAVRVPLEGGGAVRVKTVDGTIVQ